MAAYYSLGERQLVRVEITKKMPTLWRLEGETRGIHVANMPLVWPDFLLSVLAFFRDPTMVGNVPPETASILKVPGFLHEHQARVQVMSRSHRHHDVEINFLERGSITYLINGTLADLPARTLAVFWATIPHQLVRAEKTASNFHVLHLPLAWLLQWEMPLGLMKPLFEGCLILDSKPLAVDPERIREWGVMIGRNDPSWKKVALLEIQARLHALALQRPVPANSGRTIHAGNLLKVEEIARVVAEHYTEPLTVEEIARRVRLGPSHTMTLFRKHSGQTLLECVNQHRIAHAQRLLVTTGDKVLNIALESGFGSLSRFYEAFTAACHTTPLRYRRGFASG